MIINKNIIKIKISYFILNTAEENYENLNKE